MVTFSESKEGRSFMRSQGRYRGKITTDGSFRIEDVPAGHYQLFLSITKNDREVAGGKIPVQVREIPGGRTDEPLNLGACELSVRPRIDVGQPAPQLVAQTVDGRPFSLQDFRGKYILIDFWATWCGPCIEGLPHLRSTYEEFGGDPRFVMAGLSLDDRAETPRKYAADHGMPWIQVFLGPWTDSKVTKDFDVQTVPSIWLIGPDGKVVAKNLSGDAIRACVAKALGRPTPSNSTRVTVICSELSREES